MAEHLKTGKLGEHLACRFLEERGYRIVERNYRKKWGEIDIIAQKPLKNNTLTNISSIFNYVSHETESVLHFIEVKTVSRHLSVSHETNYAEKLNVARETGLYNSESWFQPEDNIHPRKLRRIMRAVQSYLLNPRLPEDIEWQFDVIAVLVDVDEKKARIRFMQNIPI